MLLYFCVSVSRITLLADLEAFFHSSRRPLPLLVRILHRSRIRYYGKPGQNVDFPFQVSQRKVLFVCRFFCAANILGLWSLSFASSLFLSFRCTVRWLIRVALCPWLYGMIFVLNGSTDWRSARFYICSSTHWNTVIRTGLDHTSAHSLLWLSTPLVWLQSFLVASFLLLHFHLGLFYTGSVLDHFLKVLFQLFFCGCSVGCRDQPESSKSCLCSDSDSSKKCSASVGSAWCPIQLCHKVHRFI